MDKAKDEIWAFEEHEKQIEEDLLEEVTKFKDEEDRFKRIGREKVQFAVLYSSEIIEAQHREEMAEIEWKQM